MHIYTSHATFSAKFMTHELGQHAAQATNAERASESAYLQSRTMVPGTPGYIELMQLGEAHLFDSHKEEKFVANVCAMGFSLPVPIQSFYLNTLGKRHCCINIRAVAEHILVKYPDKLLAGHSCANKAAFYHLMEEFWKAFRLYNASHPVFRDFANNLRHCIPTKMHIDEGTGLRRAAVNQFSWGPLLSSSANSLDRYFFWSCMNGEEYKNANAVYERGNAILDEVGARLAAQAQSAYLDGVNCPGIGKLHLVWVALEGDLPAQARAFHCKRNFNCMPNQLCPWCLADDFQVPFTDFRPVAAWRSTVGASRPWTTESPMVDIAGAGHEVFLAKDLFHLCHLGAVRGFAVNVLCYLATMAQFDPGLTALSNPASIFHTSFCCCKHPNLFEACFLFPQCMFLEIYKHYIYI